MSYFHYSTDQLVKGHVDYEKEQTMTVADTVVYKTGLLLARDSATLKLIPYVKGGTTNGNGVAKYVLPEGFTATATGDVKVNVIKRTVDKGLDKALLVIQADGDASNITSLELEQLRSMTIQVEEFTEQSVGGRT